MTPMENYLWGRSEHTDVNYLFYDVPSRPDFMGNGFCFGGGEETARAPVTL